MADGSNTPTELTMEPASAVRAPRRRALWAVLAAAALAAGALAVTSGGEDGSSPVLPVALGAGGAEGGAGMASPAADSRMARVTYVAGDDLPAMGGDATAFRVAGDVDEAQVRALADALGLEGDPVREERFWRLTSGDAALEVYEDSGGTWWYSLGSGVTDAGSSSGGGSAGCEGGPGVDCAVAPEVDAAVPTTSVVEPECPEGAACGSADAPVSSPDSGVTTATECEAGTRCVDPAAPTCDPEGVCTLPAPPECAPDGGCVAPPPIEPQPPADLPSEDEARQIALDLLGATGMDLAGAKVTVDGPYDAWYVTVEPLVDGLPVAGWMSSVSVGSKGAVVSASGTLAAPESVGEYPLLDTRAAIDRLNEQQGSWFAYGAADAVARSSVAESGAGEVSTSTGYATEGDVAVGGEDPACAADGPDCQLVDPVPPPATEECAVQPDGTEVCKSIGVPIDGGPVECVEAPAGGGTGGAAGEDVATCAPAPCLSDGPPPGVDPATTVPTCGPYPEPEPVELVLRDAQLVLVLMPSIDGSGDAYLIPGYRFSGDDGAIVEIAAVDDESLAPTTTSPEVTEPVGPPETTCETLVEDDGSGTTQTLNPCPDGIEPSQSDLTRLSEGEEPQVGVAYYVDVTVMTGHCSWVTAQMGDRWWIAQLSNEELASWSTPTEGGTFTLLDEARAEFVGDAARTKVAELTPLDNEPGCA